MHRAARLSELQSGRRAARYTTFPGPPTRPGLGRSICRRAPYQGRTVVANFDRRASHVRLRADHRLRRFRRRLGGETKHRGGGLVTARSIRRAEAGDRTSAGETHQQRHRRERDTGAPSHQMEVSQHSPGFIARLLAMSKSIAKQPWPPQGPPFPCDSVTAGHLVRASNPSTGHRADGPARCR